MSVVNLDTKTTKSSYSNHGPQKDIAAPGTGILSTIRDSVNSYGYNTGTSMASPVVAAAAALCFAAKPTATPAEVRRALESTATDIGTQGKDSVFGWGRLNAYAAVLSLGLSYATHVEGIGNQAARNAGDISGTSGESRRLEAITISLGSAYPYTGGIRYSTHIEDYGWEDQVASRGWKTSGQLSGTRGESKRLEAIKIELTGDLKNYYDVYYQVHAENAGWLTWAKNGAISGTAGYSWRLEAIRIAIVPKGATMAATYPNLSVVSTPTGVSAIDGYTRGDIAYNATIHIQDLANRNFTNQSSVLGTVGSSKRLEALTLLLPSSVSGTVEYFTHVENIGNQLGGGTTNPALGTWRRNAIIGGAAPTLATNIAGTQGRSLRLEAVGVRLTGALATQYDVYFRTHVQNIGWTGWTKNTSANGTAVSGSAGYSYRMEAMQIVIVKKGTVAPGIVGMQSSYYRR
jgi:uncharacterized protein YjdB